MHSEGYKIEYRGLTPDDSIRHKVNDLVQKIQANAPSDSNILLGIEKAADGLKARFKISATSGFFEAEAAKSSLRELCQTIEKDINGQLAAWKKDRFKN